MNYARIDSEELYEHCLRGDEGAWGYVYNYVLAIARSPRWNLNDPLEDVAQSVVCHLLGKGLDRVRERKAFRAYVRRMAVNLILDTLKRKQVWTRPLEGTKEGGEPLCRDPQSPEPDPEEATLGGHLSRALERGLESLSEACREVLEAYVDYKLGVFDSYRALADHFGRTVGTLSSTIKRCLDRLRDMPEVKTWLQG